MAVQSLSPWLSGWRFLLICFVSACLLFGPLYNAGFVTDFLGWLECRETTPFWRAYECFGNRGLYYSSFVILGFLSSLFDLHPLPWFIVWTGLHAVNTWLVVDVCRKLFGAFQIQYHVIVPLLAGLLFMAHPWQVEVIAWKACSNYLAACALMLFSLRSYLMFLTEGSRKHYWFSVGAYFVFLYTLEYALLFPAILAMLFWSLRPQMSALSRIRKIFIHLIPFVILLGVWFVSNKLLFGLWIGHYGAETHTVFEPLSMSSTMMKYVAKTLLLTRFFSFPWQTEFYAFFDHAIVRAACTGLWIGLILLLLFRVSRMKAASRLRLFLFLSAILLIVPIANLYFYYLQYSENDRYTYLPLAFLSIWLMSFASAFRLRIASTNVFRSPTSELSAGEVAEGRNPLSPAHGDAGLIGSKTAVITVQGSEIRNPKSEIVRLSLLVILIIYLFICLLGTRKLVLIWEKSTTAYWHHIHTFPAPQKQKVFLLNVPDNYLGTFMFRNIGGDSSFEEVYRYIAKSDYNGKMYDVFQYNMTDLSNDFIVTKESENKIKVEFSQWGNWWWRNGIGGEKYSNEEYIAWPEGKWYYVEFKKPLEEAEVLYHTSEGWKIVK